MNKNDFLEELRNKLSSLPDDERDERIAFYCEMIDDRIEEGLSEEAAVAEISDLDDTPYNTDSSAQNTSSKKTDRKRKLSAVEITLLIVGFPIWLPILVSVFAVYISLFAALWSVVVSLWSVFASLAATSLGCVAGGVVIIAGGETLPGIALIAAGPVCAGLSILMFMLCTLVTKASARLCAATVCAVKAWFKKWRSA
ncbi:MAG: DUF1700 domain-containing protein [Clostridia bacterium]|nr:DUF1700 domain-containing protein [Clostridia bacterium]